MTKLYDQTITAIAPTAIEINPAEYNEIRHKINHNNTRPIPNVKSAKYTSPKPAIKKDNTTAIIIFAILSQPH